MTSPDPIKAAFESRNRTVASHVNVEEGLESVRQQAAMASHIRQGAMAAVVVIAMIAGGFAFANRGDGDGGGEQVATAPAEDTTSTTEAASTVPTTAADGSTATSDGTGQSVPATAETTTSTAADGEVAATTDTTNSTTSSPTSSSSTPSSSSSSSSSSSTSTSSSSTSTSSTSTSTTSSTPVSAITGREIDVEEPLWRVVNVGHNDELNVRAAPDQSAEIVGTLAPAMTGIEATGRGRLLDSGATWLEIKIEAGPVGWANAFYLEPMNGGTGFEDLACNLSGGSSPIAAPSAGSGGSTQVVSIGQFNGPCDRIVITLDKDQFVAGTTGYSVDDSRVRVDLPGVDLALQQDNTLGNTYIVRDGQSGEFYAERFASPAPSGVTFLTQPARIVIDVAAGSGAADFDYLSGIVVITEFLEGDSSQPDLVSLPATVAGFGRPFEAVFGIAIIDAATGDQVTASWSGGFGGSTTTDLYAVNTSDWVSAWGEFEFSFDGLAPGDYILRLDEGGGDVNLHDTPFSVGS